MCFDRQTRYPLKKLEVDPTIGQFFPWFQFTGVNYDLGLCCIAFCFTLSALKNQEDASFQFLLDWFSSYQTTDNTRQPVYRLLAGQSVLSFNSVRFYGCDKLPRTCTCCELSKFMPTKIAFFHRAVCEALETHRWHVTVSRQAFWFLNLLLPLTHKNTFYFILFYFCR